MTAPVQSKVCGHSYCDRCIRLSLDRKRECPSCRRPCDVRISRPKGLDPRNILLGEQLDEAHFIEESLSELEVMCPRGVKRTSIRCSLGRTHRRRIACPTPTACMVQSVAHSHYLQAP